MGSAYEFECAAFRQRYDDCLYVGMNHDELYARFGEVWPEVRSFIRTGRFSASRIGRRPTPGRPLRLAASRRRGERAMMTHLRHPLTEDAGDAKCQVGEDARRAWRPASGRIRSPWLASYSLACRLAPTSRRIFGRSPRGPSAGGSSLHSAAAAVQSARRHACRRMRPQTPAGEIFKTCPTGWRT